MSNSLGDALFRKIFDTDNLSDVKKVAVSPLRSNMAEKPEVPVSAVRETIQASRETIQPPADGKPVQKRSYDRKIKAPEQAEPDFKLDFTTSNIMNGFILSELLGKPKILQKRRW